VSVLRHFAAKLSCMIIDARRYPERERDMLSGGAFGLQ
jgi:hypothetical protein